jgi:uncharacterized phage-associated protein
VAPYDHRAIANLLLDEADARGCGLTHLALQKLVYFSHALHIVQVNSPLVTGYFEAWPRGPVHPGLYESFKLNKSNAITSRASRINYTTGALEPVEAEDGAYVRAFLGSVFSSYGTLSAWQLVQLSHAPNGPWDFVVKNNGGTLAYGLRISDKLIKERFRFHKIAIGSEISGYGFDEEAPPA